MKNMNTSITILVDNHAGEGLVSEHGLAVWIEADGQTILFDTGQAGAFKENVRSLGIDLTKTDTLVLSHGHYDHTGNLPVALQSARKAHIYCHPGVVRPHYTRKDGEIRGIQMPTASMAALDALPHSRLHWVQNPVMLSENVGLTGPIPRLTEYEDTGGPFSLDPEGTLPDPIEDDLALWIRTKEGLVVCLGCCHSGIVNTLRHIRHISGTEKIRAVIGGLHLVNADQTRIRRTIEVICAFSPDLLVPCHCTGDAATSALQAALIDQVTPGAAGMAFRFE